MAAVYRAIVWPRALVVPMSSASLDVPILNHTTAPATGNTAFSGGVIAYWQEQGNALQESEPAFNQGKLIARDLIGYAILSNALLEDMGRPMESYLLRLRRRAGLVPGLRLPRLPSRPSSVRLIGKQARCPERRPVPRCRFQRISIG